VQPQQESKYKIRKAHSLRNSSKAPPETSLIQNEIRKEQLLRQTKEPSRNLRPPSSQKNKTSFGAA